jgi:hypothetical protein
LERLFLALPRMQRFPTMFKAAKDAMTSRAAQVYVNNRIARYGEVQTLRINSREKTMEVSCLLHGESDPITIKVETITLTPPARKSISRRQPSPARARGYKTSLLTSPRTAASNFPIGPTAFFDPPISNSRGHSCRRCKIAQLIIGARSATFSQEMFCS